MYWAPALPALSKDFLTTGSRPKRLAICPTSLQLLLHPPCTIKLFASTPYETGFMARTPTSFSCTECATISPKWLGQCPSCSLWGTLEPTSIPYKSSSTGTRLPLGTETKPQPITELSLESIPHAPSGVSEFDRVLGGGFVPGATLLLTGEPGIGKSTLLLNVIAQASQTRTRTLYVSAEESRTQVYLRAQRTENLRDNLYLLSENDLSRILAHIEQLQPELIVIDSVQTLLSDEIPSSAGSANQVRHIATCLINVAKQKNIPLIMVGHVTKDGTIAGPKVLEHLVDVVFHFEGDRHSSLRFVRCIKNRFGPTDETGCFEMTERGMVAVPDPSSLFLSDIQSKVSGTCVTVALEGTRPVVAEIQALVVPTASPNPRRVTHGVDASRLAMLLAILERRCNIALSQADVYVSTVGGVRLLEPASDLAITLALTSAMRDLPIRNSLAAFGEISLAGEIRQVKGQKQRKNEAIRLGYKHILTHKSLTLREAINASFPETN